MFHRSCDCHIELCTFDQICNQPQQCLGIEKWCHAHMFILEIVCAWMTFKSLLKVPSELFWMSEDFLKCGHVRNATATFRSLQILLKSKICLSSVCRSETFSCCAVLWMLQWIPVQMRWNQNPQPIVPMSQNVEAMRNNTEADEKWHCHNKSPRVQHASWRCLSIHWETVCDAAVMKWQWISQSQPTGLLCGKHSCWKFDAMFLNPFWQLGNVWLLCDQNEVCFGGTAEQKVQERHSWCSGKGTDVIFAHPLLIHICWLEICPFSSALLHIPISHFSPNCELADLHSLLLDRGTEEAVDSHGIGARLRHKCWCAFWNESLCLIVNAFCGRKKKFHFCTAKNLSSGW